MIIFKKQYERAGRALETQDEELRSLLNEAAGLIERAGQGVKRERSPVTMVEKIQISDAVKLVKKLMIDIDRDMLKGRPVDKNREKLEKAVTALKTSIDNIL